MADITLGENNFAKDWVQRYTNAKSTRAPYEADWRKVAELGLPRQFGGWTTTNAPHGLSMGAARASRINTYDSTLGRSLPIHSAVLERVLTPGTQQYHTIEAEDPRKRVSRSLRLGFEALNDTLFRMRYQSAARFSVAQAETYMSGGAYGNAGKMITWRKPNKQMKSKGGLLYRNIPFRDLFWDVDEDEQIYTRYRRINWTARQAYLALGDKCPKKLAEIATGKATNADQTMTHEFFQCISPSQDYDEHALDYRRHPIGSFYIYVEEPTVVQPPAGYSSNPLIITRTATEGGVPYGYGPAQTALSTIGLLNAQKKTWIRQGQLAVQPPLLTRDDGVMNGTVDLVPGAQNPGGVNAQGQRMVYPLEMGNFQIMEKMIAEEQNDVKDVLFGRIFDILRDQPQMTATQVLDIAAREASSLAPTMGRWQADDLGPTIEREIHLLAENNALPEDLPMEVFETDYKPVYTSTLAKAQHSEAVSGFIRLSEMAMNIAKMSGNMKPVNRLNFDVAMPEIATQQGVPARWVKSDDEMAADDREAQQDKETATALEALPGVASIAKTVADNNLKVPQ